MTKHLLLFTFFFFSFTFSVFGQKSAPSKIMLAPSMVINESGQGDAMLLIDEQEAAGDPLNGSGGHPENYWFPGWQADHYPASAYIDLGENYRLSHIFLYDFTGISDFTIEIGEPDNWTHLFTDDLSSYKTWKRHDVNIVTRYIKVTRKTAGGNMNEIVLYGKPVSHAPELTEIPNQFMLERGQLTIDIAASDIDNDSLMFSVNSNDMRGSFEIVQHNRHRAKLRIVPGDTPKGKYEVSVMVNDGQGGKDSTVFLLTINEPYIGETAKLPLHPSMIINESGQGDATLLVDEQETAGDPLNGSGGNPQSYWLPDHHPSTAYIDLGKSYRLSHIFLYDFAGVGDFTVDIGEPGNWGHLFTDDLSTYKTWKRHDVNIVTRYIKVTRKTAGGNMNEIVLYGEPVNHAPVFDEIPNQFMLERGQLTIGISALDIDNDSLMFSVNSNDMMGSFEIAQLNRHSAKLRIIPGDTPKGKYEVSVMVNDGQEGKDSTVFLLTINEPYVGGTGKLPLHPSMVINESGQGDAALLVDEQEAAGDPLNGSGGHPENYWFPGWQADPYPASAYIDLGENYRLSHIFLYDFTGISDFTIEIGEPDNWMHLFTDDLSSYKTWKRHDVNIVTRYIKVTRKTAGGNMNEIILYGEPVNRAPVLDEISTQSIFAEEQLSLIFSATDIDEDSLTFSISNSVSFVSLTNLGNNTASLQIMPQEGDEGSYSIQVTVSDGNGKEDSATFMLIVNPPVKLVPTPPADLVRNRPVDEG